MPTMTNPETGETKEISMEEFMEAMKNGNGEIQQLVKHADGTTTTTTLYGNIHNDGLDRSVNIFVDTETLNAFMTRKVKKLTGEIDDPESEKDPDELYEMTVDFTDTAIMSILKATKEELSINIYTRDEQKATYDYLRQGSKTWKVNPDGTIAFNGADLQDDDNYVALFMLAFLEMRQFLRATGKLAELKKLENRGTGVIIRATDEAEDAVATIVQGKNRPDLPCNMFLLGEQMMRPYMDEIMSGMMLSEMSLDEKIKEAENGNPDAMELLAQMYLNGDDVEQSFEKCAYWLEKLANAGNANGQFNIGLHYAKGCGVERDFDKAATWMKLSAENGDEDAPAVAETYENASKNIKKAKEGDAVAQAELAKMFMQLGGSLEQYGPQNDYAEAFKWAQKASDQDNGDGVWALALCYEHGRGVEKNVKKAVELYRKGAELNHAPSQHSLACYYLRGEVLEKNEKLGFELSMKSANQGYSLAMNTLGWCYQMGIGVDDDMQKAIKYYEKYLESNDDPELEQKVALFKELEENSGFGFGSDDDKNASLPDGYMDALNSFAEAEKNTEAARQKIQQRAEKKRLAKEAEEARKKAEKEAEKKKKEAELARKKAEKEAEEKRLAEEAEKKKKEAVEKAKQSISAAMQHLNNELASVLEDIKNAKTARGEEQKKLRKTLTEYQSKIDQLQKQKSALGFFKFQEKKQLNLEISETSHRISEINSKELSLLSSYNSKLDSLTKKQKKLLSQRDDLSKRTKIVGAPVSAVVTFGIDPDEKKPLEWIIVKRDDTEIRLLSCKIIYRNAYFLALDWLNGKFMQNAFNMNEQQILLAIEDNKKIHYPTPYEVGEHLQAPITSSLRSDITDHIRKSYRGYDPKFIPIRLNEAIEAAHSYWGRGYMNSQTRSAECFCMENGKKVFDKNMWGNDDTGIRPIISIDVSRLNELF